jgi:Cys-tRNA(Pro)/Cys-tRNA(Cys) deacylase
LAARSIADIDTIGAVTARGTPAIELLRRERTAHVVHAYAAPTRHGRAHDERPDYGAEAAAALGVDPARVLKTLVVRVDERLALAVVAVDRQLDLRRVGAAFGARRAELADPVQAERATGCVVGGISPLASRRPLPVALDRDATTAATVLVSAGRRGLQVELAPADLVRLSSAIIADLARSGSDVTQVD